MRFLLVLTSIIFCAASNCCAQIDCERIFVNGNVLLCDPEMTQVTGFAISDGKIVAVGSSEEIESRFRPKVERVDLAGATVTPGFCDSHLHFTGLGESLRRIDLRNASSWPEIVELIRKLSETLPKGTWIEGRGWHQSKWKETPQPSVEGYPVHSALSATVPDHPVVLTHASGHASIVNAMAMRLAKIDRRTGDPEGGEIVRDSYGNAIGILRENAQGLIYVARYGNTSRGIDREDVHKLVSLASAECLRHGITSVHDAGSSFEIVDALRDLAKQSELPIRINAMIREDSRRLRERMDEQRWREEDPFFRVRSVKVSIDGALGPHGAWLLESYEDLPSSRGLNTVGLGELEEIAEMCKSQHWQLCVHAIGDRANREVLNVFEKVLGPDSESDHRWRIEHAQHVDPADLPRFGKLGVIPAMQAVHCTSDAPFVMQRLGQRRAESGAYMWRSLLDSGCIIPNGTDAPVELVDPRASLFAAVTRELPSGVTFFPKQVMGRKEALLSYTLWPAIAGFQADDQGTLEPGKNADFAIWDTDLLKCDPAAILKAKVKSTWVEGACVYQAP